MVEHRREGDSHQVISADFKATVDHLKKIGAESIQENRMSIDEIAVQILKRGNNVEAV